MSEIAEADDSAAQNPQFAGSVKPRLAAVPVSRPTAASAHHVEQTPELHDLAADEPVEDATWHLNTLASGRDALQFTSVRAPRSTARPPCPLPRSAPQRWNASRGMIPGTYQRNSLTHLDRPPLLWACGSRRRSPLTRPQQSCSPRSRTPPRSGAPVPCSLPPTSRYLLCVRLNLVTWTVRQTMRESNPTFVGVFGTRVTCIMSAP